MIELVEQFFEGKVDATMANPPVNWVGNVYLDLRTHPTLSKVCQAAVDVYFTNYNCDQILMFVPSVTEAEWFYNLAKYPILFMRGSNQALIYLGTRYLPFYKTFEGELFYRCN